MREPDPWPLKDHMRIPIPTCRRHRFSYESGNCRSCLRVSQSRMSINPINWIPNAQSRDHPSWRVKHAPMPRACPFDSSRLHTRLFWSYCCLAPLGHHFFFFHFGWCLLKYLGAQEIVALLLCPFFLLALVLQICEQAMFMVSKHRANESNNC